MKQKKQSGIALLEIILGLALLAMFLTAIIMLMQRRSRILRNESTAAYMVHLLEATSSFVEDNQTLQNGNTITEELLQNNINSAASFAAIDVQDDLIENGYLFGSFATSQSPYREKAEIRIIEKQDTLHVFVLHPVVSSIKTFDSVRIASLIPGGAGGIYFPAAAPANTCTTQSVCIQGILGLWTYDVTTDSTFDTAFAGIVPIGNTTAPVAHIRMTAGDSPYLYREKVWGNLAANTINANLNVSNIDENTGEEGAVNIFFNALGLDVDNNFEGGTQLVYSPGIAMADDLSTPLVDESASNRDPTLTLTDTSGLDYDSDGFSPDLPVLSSDGGLSTGLMVSDGDSCTGMVGRIALNANDGFMQCVNSVWSAIGRIAVVETSTVPTDASGVWVILQDSSTGRLYQAIIENGNVPSGFVINQTLGYVE